MQADTTYSELWQAGINRDTDYPRGHWQVCIWNRRRWYAGSGMRARTLPAFYATRNEAAAAARAIGNRIDDRQRKRRRSETETAPSGFYANHPDSIGGQTMDTPLHADTDEPRNPRNSELGQYRIERRHSGSEDGYLWAIVNRATDEVVESGWLDEVAARAVAADMARMDSLSDGQRATVEDMRSVCHTPFSYMLAILDTNGQVIEMREVSAQSDMSPSELMAMTCADYFGESVTIVDTDANRRRLHATPLEIVMWPFRDGSVHAEMQLAAFTANGEDTISTHAIGRHVYTACGLSFFGTGSASGLGNPARIDCPCCRAIVSGQRGTLARRDSE